MNVYIYMYIYIYIYIYIWEPIWKAYFGYKDSPCPILSFWRKAGAEVQCFD